MSSESGLAGAAAAQEPRGARDFAELTCRALESAFNHGDFGAVREITAADAVTHDPSLPRELEGMRGPEPFVQQVSRYRAAFPDLHFRAEDTIAEDDRVAIRWRADGTHQAELRGLAPTGVRASTTGISISRWESGKAVEFWAEWDNLGLARQIGAAPPEGSIGERLATAAQQLIARRMRRSTGA